MLKISNLKLGYGGKMVVEVPLLTVKPGEHLLVTGKSGVGKTTLLYAIAGLLKPQSGSIELEGKTINDNVRAENIGIIFQTLHMVGAVSVLDNILLAAYMSNRKQDKMRALELLKTMGVEQTANKKPMQISQGQAQRAAIARAAINSPKIILGDEPTSALDDESAEKVIKLLFDVAAQSGSTLIISSHDSRIKKHFSKNLNLGGTK